MRGPSAVESLLRDVRYAVRSLRRTPAFTGTVLTTLALVIGACTAVFSLADAALLRGLPYPDAERLAFVQTDARSPRGSFINTAQDAPVWEALRDHATTVDAAVFSDFSAGGVNLVVNRQAVTVRQERVSAGFFRVLGVAPFKGREFSRDEDRLGGPAVTVLSHALWLRTFAADPDIIGKPILLRGEPYTVIGVMPRDFRRSSAEIWTPLRPSATGEGGGTNYQVIVRLKPGVEWSQVENELRSFSTPETFRLRQYTSDVVAVLGLVPMEATLSESNRQPIAMLGAAIATVLLIACVNLAMLYVARGASRSKEIATRMALGSGRAAVVRQLVVESATLAISGGTIGAVVAVVALAALKSIGGVTFEDWLRAAVDYRALGVTAALSILTSLGIGLVPAIHAGRLDVQSSLTRTASRGVAGGRLWPRRLLLVSEVTLGTMLLVLAGLLIRTVAGLQHLSPGFDPSNLTTARVSLQDARYTTKDAVARLLMESVRRLREAPGVESATVSLGLPYERLLNLGFRFTDAPEGSRGLTANVCYVTPGFVDALRIPLIEGRALAETDTTDAPPVVLVNATFARVYAKDQPVIGRRIRMSGAEREIVGIIGDVQQRGSGFFVPGMATGPLVGTPSVYMPVAQTSDGLLRTVHTWFTPVWIVRTRPGQGGAAEPAIRDAIAAVDPLLPLHPPQSMVHVMAASVSEQRLLMTLLASLAAAAVLLSAVGLYGLLAHSVAERRRELGIRIALGASPLQTARRVALSGVALAVAGVIAGGVVSIVAARLVESFLWGVTPQDPVTFLMVAAVMVVVSAAASVIPAWRVVRIDPAEQLKA